MRTRVTQSPFSKTAPVLALIFGMVLMTSTAVRAEVGPDRVIEQYKGWTLTCQSSAAADGAAAAQLESCTMEQSVRDSKSGATVMKIAIAAGRAAPEPKGTIIGPFGVDLAQGVDLSVDGAPAGKLGYRTCVQGGCIADLSLDEVRLAAFRGGETLVVTIRPADNPEKDIALTFPLAGFGDALARLQSAVQ